MPESIRTSEKEALLLDALRERPVYASACRKARISRNAFHHWRRDDPDFAAKVKEARADGFDALEDALAGRGLHDDTTAAIFLLKSHRREVYGDRVDHTHNVAILFDPGWIALRSAILDALADYPDAYAAVMGRIAALGAGDG